MIAALESGILSRPQLPAGQPRAVDQCLQLRPGDLRMDATAEPAVCCCNQVVSPDDVCEAQDPLHCHDVLGMLDHVGGNGQITPGIRILPSGKRMLLPDVVLVFMADIRGLDLKAGPVR